MISRGSPPFIMIQRSKFSEISDRALEDGDLRGGIAGGVEFRANLVLEVGRIADAVDQEIEKALGRKQALRFELLNGFVAHRDVGAAKMEHDIVVAALTDTLEPKPLHDGTSQAGGKAPIVDKFTSGTQGRR